MKKAESKKKIKITKIKSDIGRKPNQRATLLALGLRKIQSTAIHLNTVSIYGMIQAVKHLVSVEDIT